MANKPAPALPLREGDQAILEKVLRTSSTTAGAAQRARIVLLASQGTTNALIAELAGVSRPTVNLWRGRYLEHGMAGLVDVQRPGRPKVVDDAAIITATLLTMPTAVMIESSENTRSIMTICRMMAENVAFTVFASLPSSPSSN